MNKALAVLSMLVLAVLVLMTPEPQAAAIAERCKKICPECRAEMFDIEKSPAGPVQNWSCVKRSDATGMKIIKRPIMYARRYTIEENKKGWMIWAEDL